jgi:formylglycine-generating enzyme required for sulfatase activity
MTERKSGQDRGIEPTAFEPLSGPPTRRRRRIRAAAVVLATLAVLGIAVLAFLFTARSLTLETEPPQASVSLSGGLVVNLGDHYLLRPGEYRAYVDAEGYLGREVAFTVTEADNQRLLVTLEKEPGHLAVTSEPAGSLVLLDDTSRGRTPVTLDSVSPGTHTLTLKHPRYFSETLEIDVAGRDITQEVAVTLKPAWGTIRLSSNPGGARVTVDGKTLGTTPLAAPVLSSGETVTLTLPGHKTWERTLAVEAGQTRTLDTVELEPADAIAHLNSQPGGASVTVNGEYRGRTPLELALSPGQPHTLRLFLDGYRTAEKTLTLASGEEQSVTVDLQARTGTVRVVSEPGGGDVYVDGKRQGSSGDVLELPARAHRIEVRKEGFAPQAKTVTPQPGLEQVLRFSLLTEEEARWRSTPKQVRTGAGQTLKLFRPETTFDMGSSRREQGRRANEVVRTVRLEQPFYLAVAKVTNAQYKQFRATHSSSHAGGKTLDTPQRPAVRVSWLDAVRYCNWLSEKDGLTPFYQISDNKVTGIQAGANGYRLPTEAEWAWAARITENGSKKFPWGDGFPPPPKAGNFADLSAREIVGRIISGYRDGFAVSAPVDAFPANDKGLFGLGHNTAEWLHDYYGIEASLGSKAEVDPLGPDTGELRVIRGASWRHGSITELRLSFRDYGLDGRDDLGFRIARYVK